MEDDSLANSPTLRTAYSLLEELKRIVSEYEDDHIWSEKEALFMLINSIKHHTKK